MSDTTTPRFIGTPTGYLMVLRQGDDVFGHLAALMRERQIPAASFTGLGFLSRVTFGFYDFDRREYRPRTFEHLELASLTGSLAWQDGVPAIHAHGVGCGADFQAVGGHLLAMEVGAGSLEIAVTLLDRRLEREVDPTIGAKILSLRD